MPVYPITLASWTDRQLHKGDAEGCLEFLAEINKLASANSAGDYIADTFEWGNARPITERIQQLSAQQFATPPVPLTEDEQNTLLRCIPLEDRINKEHKRVTTACSPLKTFIDNHLSTDLAIMVEDITTDTSIPVYKQVRSALKLIKNSCLGTPSETRDMLMQKFKMGTARTPAEVVTALDNIAIIQKQLKIHHATVNATEDEVATTLARTRNPAAPAVMKTCQEPPKRQELVAKLDSILDRSSPSISAIISKIEGCRDAAWDTIVAQVRNMAERHAAQDRQKAQSGPSPVAAPTRSSSAMAAATANASAQPFYAPIRQSTSAPSLSQGYAPAPQYAYPQQQQPQVSWQSTTEAPRRTYTTAATRPCTSEWLETNNCCRYELEHQRACIYYHPRKHQVTSANTTPRVSIGPVGYAASAWQDQDQHTPPDRTPSPVAKKGRPSTPG